jgi:short-subunit dehydrogenase involved in D-alanine esterification of teichoic acids
MGKEIARTFTAISTKVCVCDIDAKALDTAAKDIPGLKTVVCDVSNRDDIERMVAASVEALGGLDVLVNTPVSRHRRRPSRTRTHHVVAGDSQSP